LKVYEVGVYSMIAPAYKVINNDCPEGAPSSGRSPGRGVDSYIFRSENLSLTFSFELSWIPASLPTAGRRRNDKATNMMSFP
ncbi:MAG: hypothetical protein AB1502_11850, partial [Thermodesulfobacteriota bacterium]